MLLGKGRDQTGIPVMLAGIVPVADQTVIVGFSRGAGLGPLSQGATSALRQEHTLFPKTAIARRVAPHLVAEAQERLVQSVSRQRIVQHHWDDNGLLGWKIHEIGASLIEIDQLIDLALGIDAIERSCSPIGHQKDAWF